RTISTCGRSVSARHVAALASSSASSALSISPATPRTPSVPNSLRVICMRVTTSSKPPPRRNLHPDKSSQPWSGRWPGLTLGELRPLARLLQAGLLALLRTRVARQEPPALELSAQVRIGLEQRPGYAVAQRACLR